MNVSQIFVLYVLGLALKKKVEVEFFPLPRVWIGTAAALFLGDVGSPQAEVQGREALLSVENENRATHTVEIGEAIVAVVLPIFIKELVGGPLRCGAASRLPKQQGANWVAPHDRIEEADDLGVIPYKLPLQSGQKELPVQAANGLPNCERLVVHSGIRSSLDGHQSGLALTSWNIREWSIEPVSHDVDLVPVLGASQALEMRG